MIYFSKSFSIDLLKFLNNVMFNFYKKSKQSKCINKIPTKYQYFIILKTFYMNMKPLTKKKDYRIKIIINVI